VNRNADSGIAILGWTTMRCARVLMAIAIVSGASCVRGQDQGSHRPPAVPLMANDPYFSVWSMGDALTDVPTKHWSEAAQPMTGLIRIGTQVYRWMGRAGTEPPKE